MTQPKASVPKEEPVPRRPWLKRLHWITWCAILLTAVPLVLILVPGEFTWSPGYGTTDWEKSLQRLERESPDHSYSLEQSLLNQTHLFVHGWPYPYMARSVIRDTAAPKYIFYTGSYEDIGWLHAECWPLIAEKRIIRWGALAIDLAVGLLILGIVGAVIEWRIRSGAGRWRFRILDALLITAVLALFLAPFAYHAHMQRLERPVLLLGHQNGIEASVRYRGPLWLRKLVGNKFFLRSMLHIDSVKIDPSDNWQEELALLEDLPYLEEVAVEHWLPLDAIPVLEQVDCVKHLTLPDYQVANAIQNQPAMKYKPFRIEHLDRLEPLGLTSITLVGPDYKAKHIRQLAKFRTMREIVLIGSRSLDYHELHDIRSEYPHVTVTELGPYTNQRPLWTEPRIDVPVELPEHP